MTMMTCVLTKTLVLKIITMTGVGHNDNISGVDDDNDSGVDDDDRDLCWL